MSEVYCARCNDKKAEILKQDIQNKWRNLMLKKQSNYDTIDEFNDYLEGLQTIKSKFGGKEMKYKMECECEKLGKRYCRREAVAKVRHKQHKEDKAFFVCRFHLPAYEWVQGKEYGNTEGSFIVEMISKQSNDEVEK